MGVSYLWQLRSNLGEPIMGDMNEPASGLQLGLAALKRQDYAEAIAVLESVQQSTPNPSTRARAEMELVKAYAQTGDRQRASALCQLLCSHANLQVQTWARQTLARLNGRSDSEAQSEAQSEVQSEAQSVAADLTGFVPFTDASPQPRSAIRSVPFPKTVPFPEANHSLSPGLPKSNRLPKSEELFNPEASSKPKELVSSARSPLPEAEVKTEVYPILKAKPEENAIPAEVTWKQAGRAKKWTSLGKVDFSKLWGVEGLTVVGFLGSVCALPWVGQGMLNWMLWQISWPVDLRRFAAFNINFTVGLIPLLLILLAVSPGLLDALLARTDQLQALTLVELERHSPEATRLLKRVCAQRHQKVPRLGWLPHAVPLTLTYGYLPNNARIVVSQGLLEQLSEDEIAALYAVELAHIRHWDFAILSWMAGVALLPHWVYWQVAIWGDRQSDRVLQTVAVIVSSLAYGLYHFLRLPGLTLARMRHYYSDRTAAELTGNPNALTRGLVKMAIGIHQEIQRQGQTSSLLERLDLLIPVGASQALRGLPNPAFLEWDRCNPYRQWLAVNNSHGALGDRLHLLGMYAQHWRLESELDWETRNHPKPNPRFLLQAAPFLGIAAGLAIALGLWSLGWIAGQAGWLGLSWLWGDRSLLIGAPLIGFSVGTFWRINTFFPDIKRNLPLTSDLSSWLSNPIALPIDSPPIRLQGKLLGRRGFSNRLHQDLLLHTETGFIRLHHTSNLGVFKNLMPQPLRPEQFLNEIVTVTGWFRRGVSPWIDVETIQTPQGRTLRGEHPVWSTTLGAIAAVLGIYMIFKGGNF
ncbi:MAG: M48 family metalloprotease [Leptolyngbyaceae cyanobacterium CSU_1_4]|nr:M48 family metalloprotease [Leptolyngbyaceae cyanobacterium CSU_1_4]